MLIVNSNLFSAEHKKVYLKSIPHLIAEDLIRVFLLDDSIVSLVHRNANDE